MPFGPANAHLFLFEIVRRFFEAHPFLSTMILLALLTLLILWAAPYLRAHTERKRRRLHLFSAWDGLLLGYVHR